mgnify:FL=1
MADSYKASAQGDADLVLRKISRDLRDMFKAYCARRGRSMTEVLVEFMFNCISSPEEATMPKKSLSELLQQQDEFDTPPVEETPRKKKKKK